MTVTLETLATTDEALALLKGIDGARGTWSWMLTEGNRGHGLVPWISNVEWWDQVYSTYQLTSGHPILLPAFGEWRAPTEDEISEFETGFPFVVFSNMTFFGEGDYAPSAGFNASLSQEDDIMEWSFQDIEIAVPIWAVTPIDTDSAAIWSQATKAHWAQFHEIGMVPYLDAGADFHDVVEIDGDEVHCPSPNDEGEYECTCGWEREATLLNERIYEGTYMPSLGPEFEQLWGWSTTRWVQAWQDIINKGSECLFSSVSRLSPYWPTNS